MKKHIVLVFLLGFSLSLLAQKGVVKGKVYNSKTNEPIEFANILIQGTDIGSTSDLDGNYIFTGITPGFIRLRVSYIGFVTNTSAEIQVQGNQTTFVDIAVPEDAFAIDEVVVRPNFNLKRTESPISVLSLGVQEIEKSAGSNRDISKVVQSLPGVGATDPNRNDLIVRGGGPSENVFYLDGVEIPVINHFSTQGSSGGAVGIINPDFVREINFYTGAFPANRTNALSSVMEIRQKDGSKDRVHAKISVGASDAALTIDGPIGKKSTFIVSARQSYLQLLFKAIGLPFLPTYNDFQLKYKYEIDKKNELTFLGIGAIDNLVLNTKLQETGTESQKYLLSYLPIYKQWNYTTGLIYKHFGRNYIDQWVLSRNMLRNRNYKYLDNDESKVKTSDYLSDEAENKLRYERDFLNLPVKLKVGAGLRYSHYTNNTKRNVFIDGAPYELNYNTILDLWAYQIFAQVSDEYFQERLKLSFGISTIGNNFNKNMSNPLNQLSPRLSASFAINDKWDVNANFGRYAAQPAYTTMGFRNTAGDYVNKNESLKYVISYQAIMGFEYRPLETLKLSVEGFYKHYDQYPLSVLDGLSIASKGADYGQIGDEEIISTGKGRAYGVEVLFKIIELKKINVTTTYTYFRSEFTDKNSVYRPSAWDTRHMVNLIASYKLPKNWNIAARWRYVGGAPYTPIDMNTSNQIAAWDITNQPYLDFANYNSNRLKDTHQLDIRIDKEFFFKKWALNLYVDVQNAYVFKSQNAPIYTNKDKVSGLPVVDPVDNTRYVLREVEGNVSGVLLPTIGLIIKI